MLAAEAAPLAKVGGLADVVGSLPQRPRGAGPRGPRRDPGLRRRSTGRATNPCASAQFPVYTTSAARSAPSLADAIRGHSRLSRDGPADSAGPLDLRPLDRGGRAQVRLLLARRAVVVGGASLEAGRRPRARLAHGRRRLVARDGGSREPVLSRRRRRSSRSTTFPTRRRAPGAFLGDYKLRRNAALDALPAELPRLAHGARHPRRRLALDRRPTYAREILTPEGGHGLDGVLRARADRLAGILNGIDIGVVEPGRPTRTSRATFDASTLARRAAEQDGAPGRGGAREGRRGCRCSRVVSRLVKEKGFDIAAPGRAALARARRAVRPARHRRPGARARVRRSSRCATPGARACACASTRATPAGSTPARTPS